MKKQRIRLVGMVLMLLLAAGSFGSRTAYAASATAELSAEKVEVKVGDTFFVYLTIASSAEFGNFEASLTYDDSLLEYQGGSRNIKGSSGFLKISDMDVTDGVLERKYTMKFEAVDVGICKIAFSENSRIMIYDMEGSDAMSVSSNTLTINVTAPEMASSNTRLKSLQTSPSVLTPEFQPEVHEYSTEVPYDTEQLIIVALPEDNKTKVTISGNDKLIEGENKISIHVLAESGDDIEYIINTTREAASSVTGPAITTVPEDGKQRSFEVVRMEDGKYAVYSGKYKLLEPDSSVVIPEGYGKTKLIISDVSVTAFSPENELNSDFLLLYAENELGEIGFYQYDKIERTLQRYVPKQLKTIGGTSKLEQEDSVTAEEYRTNLNRAAVVIAILSALCALFITLLIRMAIKARGYKEDDLE